MLFDKSNFNFGVIAYNKDTKLPEPCKLVIKSNHKKTIIEDWHRQYSEFMYKKGIKPESIPTHKKDPIDFVPGGDITDDDIFEIKNYTLPPYIENINASTITNERPINREDIKKGVIRGIMGLTADNTNNELILFQKFQDSTQLLNSWLSMSFDPSAQTFKEVEDRVISFRNKLTAVYQHQETINSLLFTSYRDTNSLLGLKENFQEASEEEIREILNLAPFDPENIDEIVSGISYYNAVRFALIKKSGILERVTPIEVKQAVEQINVNQSEEKRIKIRLTEDDSKIIFPVNKTEYRNILKILNEELFTGLLTGTAYYAPKKNPIT